MPRARGSKDYIALSLGLITEASPLAFPEGATSNEQNFLLDTNGGKRRRRVGLENNLPDFTITGDGGTYDSRGIVETFYWEEPNLLLMIYNEVRAGSGTMRSIIRFHKGTIALDFKGEYIITNTASDAINYSISGSTNFLTITSDQGEDPILLEYNPDTVDVKVYTVDIHIRDFELVDDNMNLTTRSVVLGAADEHQYNLLNAGWYAERIIASSGTSGSPITAFKAETSNTNPSNADIAILGMQVDGAGDNEWSFLALDETKLGNTEAPRGHYVYDINDFNRLAKIASPTLDGVPSSTVTLQATVSVV